MRIKYSSTLSISNNLALQQTVELETLCYENRENQIPIPGLSQTNCITVLFNPFGLHFPHLKAERIKFNLTILKAHPSFTKPLSYKNIH